jgi:hypothetical protein
MARDAFVACQKNAYGKYMGLSSSKKSFELWPILCLNQYRQPLLLRRRIDLRIGLQFMVQFCTMLHIIRVSKSAVTNISSFQCWNNVVIHKALELARHGTFAIYPSKSGLAKQTLLDT